MFFVLLLRRLAPNNTSWFLQKYARVPSVHDHQQRFLRCYGTKEATQVDGMASTSGFVAERLPGGSAGWQLELAAELSVTEAPAAFALPVAVGCPLGVPFKVALKLEATLPLEVSVSVGVCVVDQAAIAALPTWTSPDPRLGGLLVGTDAHGTMTLTQAEQSNAEGAGLYAAAHEFSFPSLAFTRSSQVRGPATVFRPFN